jgi:hypothetical protein
MHKLGWSLLLLLQFATGAMLFAGAMRLPVLDAPQGTSQVTSAAQLLEKAASSGTLLEQPQQAAVLRYCAGLREDLEQGKQEVLEKQWTIRSTFLWTAGLLWACGIATLALLWMGRRGAASPSAAAS